MKIIWFHTVIKRFAALLLLADLAGVLGTHAQVPAGNTDIDSDTTASQSVDVTTEKPIKKVLFLGDSMTGWMAERLNAYGELNDFEVATIVWDGSTIKKWGNAPKLREIIEEQSPDAVFISLGMNELFEQNPEKNLKTAIENIKSSIGDTPFLWIGPPSWPGHDEGNDLNDWLESEMGSEHYFRSSDMDLPRQSASNPHPDKAGIEVWIDNVVAWIPDNTELKFNSLNPPEKGSMSRGQTFIYKRMKEEL
ncbi:MAG: SGNH/GDSL hydrolase family protein [Bacteroides sp.]|nr:SGNH/GDSL hydrolase family protein [Bacteroides sp.]